MVVCPKCGVLNPDDKDSCMWCGAKFKTVKKRIPATKDVTAAVPETGNETSFVESTNFGIFGAFGYLILIISSVVASFVAITLAMSLGLFAGMIVGTLMIGYAWVKFGKLSEDRLMKLFGVLFIGFTILTVLFLAGLFVAYFSLSVWGWNLLSLLVGALIYVIPAAILTFVILHKLEKCAIKTIVVLLLILSMFGYVGMYFLTILSFLALGGLIGLAITEIGLHIRCLLVAGAKLENQFFRFSGWLMLIYALFSLAGMGFISYGVTGQITVFTGVGSTQFLPLSLVQWLGYAQLALYALASVLAANAFFGIGNSLQNLGATPKPKTSLVHAREIESKSKLPYLIIAIAIAALVMGGVIYASAQSPVTYNHGHITATVSGYIADKDETTTDNYVNGKALIEILILTDDIDDVLDSRGQLTITMVSRTRGWTTGALNIKDSGATEAQYGQTFVMDGVLDIDGMDRNLYVKVTVPTNSGGDVKAGNSIRIDMWPTSDSASAMNGTVSAASHFTGGTVDNDIFWDNGDTIDIYVTGRADALTLTGFDGAYLIGSTMT